MEKSQIILQLFPASIRKIFEQIACHYETLEEIRLRVGRPILIYERGEEQYIDFEGKLTADRKQARNISESELKEILNYLCSYSLYAYEEEIKMGYITVPGGHRVGMAGQIVMDENGKVKRMKNISSMNIRISHQIKGTSDAILPWLFEDGQFQDTLIISSPGMGKTTLLRDLIRNLSDGTREYMGQTVAVVDERSEIGGCFMGVAQNDVGMRTDILDGCLKLYGMRMLMRSMTPKIVAIDEIGGKEEMGELRNLSGCGCKLLATIHGESMEDIKRKEWIRQVLDERLFRRFVLIKRDRESRIIYQVYKSGDEDGIVFSEGGWRSADYCFRNSFGAKFS